MVWVLYMRLMFILLSFFVLSASAHEAHVKNDVTQLAISLATDQHNKLWRVEIVDGYVAVTMSQDFGKNFSKSVYVNPEKQALSAKGEVRPKIALGPNGEVYVAWMQNLTKRFAGHIWFARSLDGGKTFEKPIIVHQDRAEIGHAFEEIIISPDGKITIIWLDARDVVADKTAGKKRDGSSIYYAVSVNRGESFLAEKKLADYSCECCRIATTTKANGTPVAMWRHVFAGGERDHMIAEIPTANQVQNLKRATFGHWKIDGCPHHGGALARGGDGADWWGYHMAYFDGNDKKPGLYYSRMDGVNWVGFPPKKVGDNARQASHPALISLDNQVSLAWLETDADNVKHIMGMQSIDGGKTWSDASLLLSVKGKADYPQLLNFKGTTYLAVNTDQGLKVVAVRP
jgi:hypothetical protein